jgi:TPR repeat protein
VIYQQEILTDVSEVRSQTTTPAAHGRDCDSFLPSIRAFVATMVIATRPVRAAAAESLNPVSDSGARAALSLATRRGDKMKSTIIPALLSLLLATSAQAQTDTVVVNAARAQAGDPHAINTAKDRMLNGRSASSCAFMDPHNPAYDPVTIAYMRGFGLDDSLSNDVPRASDLAPQGDVSNSLSGTPRATGCRGADWRFAAGRNRIARHDRTLALGFEAFDNKDYARALQMFGTAWTKIGYDEAALMLAHMHLYGLGTAKDGAQAVAWLEKIDDKPYDPARSDLLAPRIDAAFMLARIHERGIGVPRDADKARAWYEKAAGYGYAPAQFQLGRAYYAGDGVPRDLNRAGAYFEAAARAGIPAALFAAGRMVDLGEGVPANPAQAIVYYKEAALKGDRDARFALGTYFYSGDVVGKDLATARRWFAAAARQGQPDAMFNLGVMAAHGEGGARDPVTAYVMFDLARQAGHDGAAAALEALAPTLTADERKRADAMLQPHREKAGS